MNIYRLAADVNMFRSVKYERINHRREVIKQAHQGTLIGDKWLSATACWDDYGVAGDVAFIDLEYSMVAVNSRCVIALRHFLTPRCELLPINIESETWFVLYVVPGAEPEETSNVVEVEFGGTDYKRHLFRTSRYASSCLYASEYLVRELNNEGIMGWSISPMKDAPPILSLPKPPCLPVTTPPCDDDIGLPIMRTLWNELINPMVNSDFLEQLLGMPKSAYRIDLADTVRNIRHAGVEPNVLKQWLRGMSYTVVFALLEALDAEPRSYQKECLIALTALISGRGRGASSFRNAVWIKEQCIDYFETNEWWAEVADTRGPIDGDFAFIELPKVIMRNMCVDQSAIHFWQQACLAISVFASLEALAILMRFPTRALLDANPLHESLLTSNPWGSK